LILKVGKLSDLFSQDSQILSILFLGCGGKGGRGYRRLAGGRFYKR